MNDIKNENVKIRPANSKDYLMLAKYRWDYLANNKNYDDDFLNTFISYLKNETELNRLKIFIAETNKIIIGNAYLILIPKTPKPNSKYNNIGYITNAYVKKEYRNIGIGTKIINELTIYSKKKIKLNY